MDRLSGLGKDIREVGLALDSIQDKDWIVNQTMRIILVGLSDDCTGLHVLARKTNGEYVVGKWARFTQNPEFNFMMHCYWANGSYFKSKEEAFEWFELNCQGRIVWKDEDYVIDLPHSVPRFVGEDEYDFMVFIEDTKDME